MRSNFKENLIVSQSRGGRKKGRSNMSCIFEPLLVLYCCIVCRCIGMVSLLSLPSIYAACLYAHLDESFLTVITSCSTQFHHLNHSDQPHTRTFYNSLPTSDTSIYGHLSDSHQPSLIDHQTRCTLTQLLLLLSFPLHNSAAEKNHHSFACPFPIARG